jgi:hypothetical protein
MILTTCLVVGAILLGMVLQTWVPPGGTTLVAAAALAGAVVVALAHVSPGRLRQTIAGFRFVATLLFVLAGLAILGTLIVQLKPPEFYAARYGSLAQAIVAFRLDDLFHGVPFALLMALFGASVIASATLRWPPRARAAGFLVCHLGLLTSLAGAAASATLAVRGRIDLYAGGDRATQVRVTRGGQPTGETAALGFDLALDRFAAESYEAEYRVGYYERQDVQDEHGAHENWKLVASFDPDLANHRLPGGDSFRLTGITPTSAGWMTRRPSLPARRRNGRTPPSASRRSSKARGRHSSWSRSTPRRSSSRPPGRSSSRSAPRRSGPTSPGSPRARARPR